MQQQEGVLEAAGGLAAAGSHDLDSHLLVQLHQAPLAGTAALLLIKVLVVVHVPAHLLLVVQGTLGGHTGSGLSRPFADFP